MLVLSELPASTTLRSTNGTVEVAFSRDYNIALSNGGILWFKPPTRLSPELDMAVTPQVS
jgi:hypothetical protein